MKNKTMKVNKNYQQSKTVRSHLQNEEQQNFILEGEEEYTKRLLIENAESQVDVVTKEASNCRKMTGK